MASVFGTILAYVTMNDILPVSSRGLALFSEHLRRLKPSVSKLLVKQKEVGS